MGFGTGWAGMAVMPGLLMAGLANSLAFSSAKLF